MRMESLRAREMFERSPVARLATAGSNGQPHLVPITFAMSGQAPDEVIVTAVDHKPKSTRALKRLRNIEENTHVSLLVDHYDDDWSQLWWVRADGEAAVTEAADRPGLVDALAAKYQQYRQHPPEGTLVTIRPHRWNGWAAASVRNSRLPE